MEDVVPEGIPRSGWQEKAATSGPALVDLYGDTPDVDAGVVLHIVPLHSARSCDRVRLLERSVAGADSWHLSGAQQHA
jgi:hypothetical protein